MSSSKHQLGFTIVELLIVIVVIAILAAVSVVAYTGIQDRARQSKVSSDISQLVRAVTMAREQQSKTTGQITGSYMTGQACWLKPNGTNLADLPATDACWVNYLLALDRITQASGVNVKDLIDPWGRPYLIDENEGENAACYKDTIAMYRLPFQSGFGVHTWTPQAQNVNHSGFSSYNC